VGGAEHSALLPPALPAWSFSVLRSGAVMDEMNEPNDQDPGPQIPAEPAPPISSRFLFVDVAALRAKQLRRGARLRLNETDTAVAAQALHKAERLAMEEVRKGLVSYDVPPTPEQKAGGQSEGEA